MTSGIYKLTFSDGTTYIGKSVDIERRWKEHADKFAKRTAAKAMQYAYDTCGMPSTSILLECHEDHIDLMEGWFISTNRPALNSAAVRTPPIEDVRAMNINYNDEPILNFSTADHCRMIVNFSTERDIAKQELASEKEYYEQQLRDIKSGTALETAELEMEVLSADVATAYNQVAELQKEVTRLKNRGFFARLFNL